MFRKARREERGVVSAISVSFLYESTESTDCYRVKTHGGFVASRIATVSSPVARQAHNLKVVGSNPTPATNFPLF